MSTRPRALACRPAPRSIRTGAFRTGPRGPRLSAFADSSALVKLYADEPAHEHVRSIGPMAISSIAQVEVPAALWRKQRLGEIDPADVGVLTAEFEADLFGTDDEAPSFAVVALVATVLERAVSLLPSFGLRAYEAIQLASAIEARAADPQCDSFACFDGELRSAAAAIGFALIPG